MTFVIECCDIHRCYGEGSGAVQALRGVNIKVLKGEKCAIVGPSGSGKSTLLQILGLLDLPSRGDYILEGLRTNTLADNQLSELRGSKIGFVFQQYHLFPRLNLIDNVALPLVYQNVSKEERRERASKMLEQVQLSHRLDHMPHQLSGGERQRCAIARAIVHNPAIILADEPTGNLDSKVKSEILEYLALVNEKMGVTVMLVTHDAPTAQWAKHIIYLRDGHIERTEGAPC